MASLNTTERNTVKNSSKKKCKKCGKRKGKSQFNSKQANCKSCCKKSVKERIKRARQFIYDYLLSHPCVDCSETNPIVLEFDHIKNTKIGQVGQMAKYNPSIKALAAEIEKCEVRCANCHRIKTAKNNGSWIYNVHCQ